MLGTNRVAVAARLIDQLVFTICAEFPAGDFMVDLFGGVTGARGDFTGLDVGAGLEVSSEIDSDLAVAALDEFLEVFTHDDGRGLGWCMGLLLIGLGW